MLAIFVLCILDIETNIVYDSANQLYQLYDATLLTRGYAQHALRPYIDSEIDHIHVILSKHLSKIKRWILLTCLVSSGTI